MRHPIHIAAQVTTRHAGGLRSKERSHSRYIPIHSEKEAVSMNPTVPMRSYTRRILLPSLVVLLAASTSVWAEDRSQWGQRHTRNMVSGETGLPDHFDPETGENVKWSVPLGTSCYSTPVVASGKVFVGTNNGQPPRPAARGRSRCAHVLQRRPTVAWPGNSWCPS